MKVDNHVSGFTLIELLVTISIILIVIGGVIAGFLAFRDRRNVEEAAFQARQFFIMAQQKASVRETPAVCLEANPQRTLRAYRVQIVAGPPQSIILSAVCTSSVTPPTTSVIEVNRYALPSGVSVASTPSITTYDFFTLEQGTTPSSPVFTLTGGTTSYRFTVSQGGTISSVTRVP